MLFFNLLYFILIYFMLCVCIGSYCIFLYSDLDLVHSQTIIQYIYIILSVLVARFSLTFLFHAGAKSIVSSPLSIALPRRPASARAAQYPIPLKLPAMAWDTHSQRLSHQLCWAKLLFIAYGDFHIFLKECVAPVHQWTSSRSSCGWLWRCARILTSYLDYRPYSAVRWVWFLAGQ